MLRLPYPKEKQKSCHQAIIDNHEWVNAVLDETTSRPCLFEDVMSLCPDGVVDESKSGLFACWFEVCQYNV